MQGRATRSRNFMAKVRKNMQRAKEKTIFLLATNDFPTLLAERRSAPCCRLDTSLLSA
jgi:hypothetical protein